MDRLCVQSDIIRAFGITGDWKAMALKGLRFGLRRSRRVGGGTRGGKEWKTRPDIASGEDRGNETGKVAIAHGSSVEFCEPTHIGLADESKESLDGPRRPA